MEFGGGDVIGMGIAGHAGVPGSCGSLDALDVWLWMDDMIRSDQLEFSAESAVGDD
jgi:hypothetical protein